MSWINFCLWTFHSYRKRTSLFFCRATPPRRNQVTDMSGNRSGIPLDSSWGQHVCTYVSGAAMALAGAAIKPSKACRGRCLSGGEGTGEVVSRVNESNATPSVNKPVTNMTGLLPLINSSDATLADNTHLSSGNRPLPSRLPPGFRLPNSTLQVPPILNCPCNCTYVSAACCFSRTVWEDPSKQIQMDPPPANASVCCDVGSGKWEPKSIGCGKSNKELGIVSLGSMEISNTTHPPNKVLGVQPKV